MTQERLKELFTSRGDVLNICVGSWKAYNECNSHEYGTCYQGNYFIDFTKLESEKELEDVLNALGWSKQEQEELFIQDYESDCLELDNCDRINPKTIIRAIKDNNVNLNVDGLKIGAMMSELSDTFEEACKECDRYGFHEGQTMEEYEEELFWDSCDPKIREFLQDSWMSSYISIDFEQMGRFDDWAWETSEGVLIKY